MAWLLPVSATARAPCVVAWACLLAGVSLKAQTLTATTSLSFGTFVVSGAGTVVVATHGGRSKTGAVYLLNQGAAAAAGQFLASGPPNASYAITLPGDGDVILTGGSGHTLAVNQFVSSPSGSGTLLGNGSGLIAVGATLVVGASQALGSYSGSFSITLNYE